MSIVFTTFFVSSCLFSLGLFGVLISTRNIVTMLLAVEVMLLAAVLNFCGVANNVLGGHVFSIVVITVAAAEAAVALALVVVYFRKSGSIDVNSIDRLKN